MKAAAFEYLKPGDVAGAVKALSAAAGEAKALGGGQSLGPMLNLRLTRPKLLVDVSRLEAMRAIEDKGGAWRLTKKDGKPYIDLMWSCGRTSWGDPDLAAAGGCHSPAQSSMPKELLFTNQKMIYDKVMTWQTPVKSGIVEVDASLKEARKALLVCTLGKKEKAQVQLMVNQAQEIIDSVKKDGSWGVHAPAHTQARVEEAKVLVQGAQASLPALPKMAKKTAARTGNG